MDPNSAAQAENYHNLLILVTIISLAFPVGLIIVATGVPGRLTLSPILKARIHRTVNKMQLPLINWTVVILATILAALIFSLAVFVWPTPYIYEKTTTRSYPDVSRDSVLRINRLTGEVRVIYPIHR